jgi:hypothetical protein
MSKKKAAKKKTVKKKFVSSNARVMAGGHYFGVFSVACAGVIIWVLSGSLLLGIVASAAVFFVLKSSFFNFK